MLRRTGYIDVLVRADELFVEADIQMFERKRLTKEECMLLSERQSQLETELRYIRQRLAQ